MVLLLLLLLLLLQLDAHLNLIHYGIIFQLFIFFICFVGDVYLYI